MIANPVIKSMEKIDVSKLTQIRERFLVDSRRHLLHNETKAPLHIDCADPGCAASAPRDTARRLGKAKA